MWGRWMKELSTSAEPWIIMQMVASHSRRRICCAVHCSATTTEQVWQLILHGNLARIASGIHPLYVSGVCPGGRIVSRRDCIGGCVLSNVPIHYFRVNLWGSKVLECLRYQHVCPSPFFAGTSSCMCCCRSRLCTDEDICARDCGSPYATSNCSFS